MGKSGHRLENKKIEKMWQLFLQEEPIQSIARKCVVSAVTVRKYMNREGWIERRKKIYQKASEKADGKEVNILAENIRLVRYCKGKLIDHIKEMGNLFPKSKTPFADLDKIIRLEQFLIGNPDSRPEQVKPVDELQSMTVEQLIILRNRLFKAAGDNGDNGNGLDIRPSAGRLARQN